MRSIAIGIVAVIVAACGRAEPSLVMVSKGKVSRINGCHVLLDDARGSGATGRAMMHFACKAPESALDSKQWWGDGFEPPGFTIDPGDCMPLDDVYYCLETITQGESATFRATFKKPVHPLGNLERIR